MFYLRDLWRRGPVHRYFADMEPIDRATFLVALVLALAIGLSANKILRAVDDAPIEAPALRGSVPA